MGWASALPFFFWASPAPLSCWGSWGFAPCVRVLQLRCCLLGLQVRSPCCPSLTLEWVCFWPTVSQVFVGCEGGLGCPSWFVILFLCLLVLHLFWGWGGLVTGLWPLLRLLVLDSSDARLHRPDALASGRTSPFVAVDLFLGRLFGLGLVGRVRASVPPFFWWCSPSLVLGFRLAPLAVGWSRHLLFLGPYLGFPLASSVGCWLEVVEVSPWLSSLRSFAVEVVTLVLCRVLVGLPSWSCCASGLLGPVVFLVCILGHLSLGRSVFFLSPRL